MNNKRENVCHKTNTRKLFVSIKQKEKGLVMLSWDNRLYWLAIKTAA